MEKINIADLLRDCPKGMELDCTIWEDVTFEEVVTVKGFDDKKRVKIILSTRYSDGMKDEIILTEFGTYTDDETAKCVIFPKGKTTWEGFVPPCKFKDGNILTTNLGSVFILKEPNENVFYYSCYVALNDASRIVTGYTKFCIKKSCRLATEEEKQKLFDAIKENGYKWNAETKTLEQLFPYNIGTKVWVKSDKEHKYIHTIVGISYNSFGNLEYEIKEEKTGIVVHYPKDLLIPVITKELNNLKLVTNKFDINTLVPFESKVLIRNDKSQRWLPAFWGYKHNNGYATTFGWCNHCIPFDGNEHLLATNDDCDDFYKTWDE